MNSPNTPEGELRKDHELWSLAQSIVNQLGDLWGAPVDVRQATNDECDDFVMALIDQHTQAKVVEELEKLHRSRGEGLPKRDYDNETDELIDDRIAWLKAQTKSGEKAQ